MQKALERGEVPEEELKALESDVTSRVLLASWRGTRMEVTHVLHRVCENVLRDTTVSEQVLVNRAKVGLVHLQKPFLTYQTGHDGLWGDIQSDKARRIRCRAKGAGGARC